MLLLITGSIDGTCDRIVAKYGDGVFRLNYDLWKEYSFAFTPEGWKITSPSGNEITSETVTTAYWWKAFAYYQTDDDKLISAEVRYIFRDLYGWCVNKGLAKGNSIGYHDRYGKMTILGIAKKYFHVPETLATINLGGVDRFSGMEIVAKSLSSEVSSENTVLMTTQVNVDQLHPKYPWYLQKIINSDWDVTVFYCNGNIFPFKRSRADLKSLDWRLDQKFDYKEKEWFPLEISQKDKESILALSNDLSINFGRYDFMIDENGNLQFLELNANGQWVFLDLSNEYGLLDCVVDWLKS